MNWPWVSARRRRQRATRLTREQAALVDRRVPAAARLDPDRRAALEGLMSVFLHEKTFEGCGGLEVTEEIRLVVAATACLLLVGLGVDEPFPDLDVIRIYPSAVQIHRREHQDGLVTEGLVPHLGLSSRRGYVVLSWEAARDGARHHRDGENVILHEFAHQLDTEDGVADGAPPLPAGLYGPWARVLGAAYAELQADVAAARQGSLDAYGATHPAEFFAVATEAFFERPERLRADEPELYTVLERYYRTQI